MTLMIERLINYVIVIIIIILIVIILISIQKETFTNQWKRKRQK